MTKQTREYGWPVGFFLVGRRIDYRRREGAWCQHPSFTGQLVDMGMRKLWTCDTCGHRTFKPRRP